MCVCVGGGGRGGGGGGAGVKHYILFNKAFQYM